MLENIVFENLNLHPEFAEKVRELFWNEWSESLKKEFHINDYSEYHLNSNITFYIAIEYLENQDKDKKLVGTIGLAPSDLDELYHLTPWMSYVYILPEYRNKGIADKMIKWYLEKIKIRPLYLWCKHPLESFYSKFGFEIIEDRSDIAIMKLL
jgi:GNAT superfamily N-acetyltransferase